MSLEVYLPLQFSGKDPAREPPARRFWAAFASSRALASPPSQRALGSPTTREPHKPDEACSARYH